jgi:hypothetical protein
MTYTLGMRIVGSIVLSASVLATTAMNAAERSMDQYRSIVERNPFGLKPVPPPIVTTAKNDTPAPKSEQFYLTGISTIGYPNKPKKAFLMNKDNSKKEYSEKFYNMQINDKQGDLRLDDIDEKGKRVKVTYRGEEMWLSMKDNGVPTPTSSAPAQPGVPGFAPGLPAIPAMNAPGTAVGNALPLPGAVPAVNAMNQPTASPSMRRLPRSNQFGNNGANSAIPAPVYAPTINGGVPQDQSMNNGGVSAQNPNPAQPALTAEEQYIHMNVQAIQGGPPPPPMTP